MTVKLNITNHIKEHGYITIDNMMREVLYLSKHSYYNSTKVLGITGDFVTSPELSQLFGEMIALWAIEKWKEIGSPISFALIELGPGSGKLMKDFLRVAKLDLVFYKAIKLFFYEINPLFINLQKESLAKHSKRAVWIKNIENIPEIPSIFIANEFFDTLPIKQYLKVKEKWFELTIEINQLTQKMQFSKIKINKNIQKQLLSKNKNAEHGAVAEISDESIRILKNISSNINKYRGAALVIDYGYNISSTIRESNQYKSTLQAVQNHKYCCILNNDALGEFDLTAHVDFNAFLDLVRSQNMTHIMYCTQREFLLKYGIELRLDRLKANLHQREECFLLDNQVRRLISLEQMGKLFKVLELIKT